MILLLSLKTNFTNAIAKVLRQCLACPAEFPLTSLTYCQVQVYHIDCRRVSALLAFTVTLVDVHAMDKADCVFTDGALVLWRFVARIIPWDKS
jgi:hypothetical protein